MAAQKGLSVLAKVSNSDSPETFVTIGGQTVTSLTFNNEQVDITNKDSVNRWGQKLRAGIRTMSMSVEGRFLDDTGWSKLHTYAFDDNATFVNFQFVFPDWGTYEGPFEVASLEMSGEYNAEATYSATFESTDEIAFSAA